MNFVKTACCAIQEIHNLRNHTTAKEAMVSFCQQALLERPKFGTSVGYQDQIYSFYLFTAAIGSGYYDRSYGQDFYDFIVSNGLGDVYQSARRPNKAWHPDHENQVYIWTPNHEAIKAWWVENNPSKRQVVPMSVAVVEVPVDVFTVPIRLAGNRRLRKRKKMAMIDEQSQFYPLEVDA